MNALVKIAAAAAIAMPSLIFAQGAGPSSGVPGAASDKLMAEEYRTSVVNIVVLPGMSPASGGVTGSYGKQTDGLIDGVEKGREIGVFRRDVGGIPISFPIRVLTVPGMIFGGLSGSIKRQIQDFRDAMTDNLVEAAASPLSNDALATDVFWRLRDVAGIRPKVFALTTPIPADTDAILYVSFSDSTIEVDGKKATVILTATATLRRLSDGQHLYENQVFYQDTDTLSNWSEGGNIAWQNYSNYARHYVGREIVAQLFERVAVLQSLHPASTDDVAAVKKDRWQGVTRSRTPTLAWDLVLPVDDQQLPWALTTDPDDVSYDLEIYDEQQLVYSAKGVSVAQHKVERELEACRSYRWSVRPMYPVAGQMRYGAWMRFNPDAANGNAGKSALQAAAYIHDFATLTIKCTGR